MPTTEQLIIAVISGLFFGWIIAVIGSSWQRLVFVLVALWALQTGPQFVYRFLSGVDVTTEVINVTILRVTFTVAAVLLLALLNRRWPRT